MTFASVESKHPKIVKERTSLMSPQNSFTQDRRSFIGGSDARIIMGTDETALLRLWKEKRGQVAPEDLPGNLIVQLGVATEALIRHWYELLEAGNAKAMALLTSERSPL